MDDWPPKNVGTMLDLFAIDPFDEPVLGKLNQKAFDMLHEAMFGKKNRSAGIKWGGMNWPEPARMAALLRDSIRDLVLYYFFRLLIY